MKYFLDTEFIEGFAKPVSFLPTLGSYNKPYHKLQLVSIALVAEDGREYHALSNEFKPISANDFVRTKVYPQLIESFDKDNLLTKAQKKAPITAQIETLQRLYGKPNALIAYEIYEFVNHGLVVGGKNIRVELTTGKYGRDAFFEKHNITVIDGCCYANPDFYGYYADYDWVLFCSLFGDMSKLPKGFPMYCRDLKQMLDEEVHENMSNPESALVTSVSAADIQTFVKHKTLPLNFWLTQIKKSTNYPKNEKEHCALADAKWNLQLYLFITQTHAMAKKLNNLDELAAQFGTDKLEHGYMQHYAKHLPINVKKLLEIGCFKGASLRMWQKLYGPKTEIHTIDLFSEHLTTEQCFNEGFVPHKGSQSDIDFLYTVKEMFDVIIDDGSHNSLDQAVSFKHLFVNNLCSGGIYVIEDLHCCNEEFYRQNGNLAFEDTMLAELKQWTKKRGFAGKMFSEGENETFSKLIEKVWVYDDKIAFIQKKK